MVIVEHDFDVAVGVYEAIMDAVVSGRLSRRQLDASVGRILELKVA